MAEYSYGLALLANTPDLVEYQLHSPEEATRSIFLKVNTKQNSCFYTRSHLHSKISRYLDSNISSTESDVNIHLPKALNTINSLSILWKSHQFYKIRGNLFQAEAVSILL